VSWGSGGDPARVMCDCSWLVDGNRGREPGRSIGMDGGTRPWDSPPQFPFPPRSLSAAFGSTPPFIPASVLSVQRQVANLRFHFILDFFIRSIVLALRSIRRCHFFLAFDRDHLLYGYPRYWPGITFLLS
jgi:hypothetical protein